MPSARAVSHERSRASVGRVGLLDRMRGSQRRRRPGEAPWSQAELSGLFAKAGANLEGAGEGICELPLSWPENRDLAEEIGRCERDGDRITREIIHGLHRGRLAADDRGDIHALAEA